MAEKDDSGQSQAAAGKNWLEWTIFGLSSVLLVTMLGYLLVQTFQVESRPPHLKAMLGEPLIEGGTTRVPVTVKNVGDQTAENVEVEIRAPDGETGTFTMAFVPRGAERQGWAVFSKPYRKSQLEAQVKGYEQP